MYSSILFVCLGNICRSPAAEAIFRKKAHQKGLGVSAQSAGTAAWHVGEMPYAPMLSTAADFGYDLSALRARQVVQTDFAKFDLIVAMDQQNFLHLKAMAPSEHRADITLIGGYLSQGNPPDVPDPYYTRNFVEAIELLQKSIDRLILAHWSNVHKKH